MEKHIRNGPDFIIIGAMKCATSTLHDQLVQHGFCMTTPKEPNFFSDDEIYTKGIEWYYTLFRNVKSNQLRGESSTHYTKLPTYPDTVLRIKNHLKNVKFIYLMRHPVDRFVSHYIHNWSRGEISCDINKAVDIYPNLINYGKYYMQLEPYFEEFGEGSILPIFVERICQHPNTEIKRVFRFLDVNVTPNWDYSLKSNISAQRLRPCVWRDWIVDNHILKSIRKNYIPKKIRTRIRKIWTMNERPVLSSVNTRKVEEIFDEDLYNLKSFLGLSLSCKNYKENINTNDTLTWDKRNLEKTSFK